MLFSYPKISICWVNEPFSLSKQERRDLKIKYTLNSYFKIKTYPTP